MFLLSLMTEHNKKKRWASETSYFLEDKTSWKYIFRILYKIKIFKSTLNKLKVFWIIIISYTTQDCMMVLLIANHHKINHNNYKYKYVYSLYRDVKMIPLMYGSQLLICVKYIVKVIQ